MSLTLSGLMVLAAVACFVIAVLIAAASVTGIGPFDAWLAGGLLAWVLAQLLHNLERGAAAPPGAP